MHYEGQHGTEIGRWTNDKNSSQIQPISLELLKFPKDSVFFISFSQKFGQTIE